MYYVWVWCVCLFKFVCLRAGVCVRMSLFVFARVCEIFCVTRRKYSYIVKIIRMAKRFSSDRRR